jgi:hypothetical protein
VIASRRVPKRRSGVPTELVGLTDLLERGELARSAFDPDDLVVYTLGLVAVIIVLLLFSH